MVDGVRMRILYAELLLSYPRHQVKSWLNQWAVAENLQPNSLLQNVWDPTFQFPLAWGLSFFHHLQQWLSEQGVLPFDFAQKAYQRFSEQPALSAKQTLRAYKPYMGAFYSAHDQRQLLLKLLSPMHSEGFSDLRLVSQSIKFGRRTDHVLFLPRSASDLYCQFDFGLWWLPQLQYAPVALGLPPFEETRMRTDMRTPEYILSQAGWEGLLPPHHECSLADFLKANGCDFVLSDLPQTHGVFFSENLVDSKGQILLHAKCLYGVPCALAEFRYATTLGKIANPFERLVGQLVDSEYSLWTQIRERHELLLQELSMALEVVYHRSDDSITVGDQHLMRNVPAKILRNVLREYVNHGRSDFENREFKRDSEICMDPVNPNFEGRLNRVIEHLDRLPQGLMQIQKSGRGRFHFSVSAPLQFREEP